MQDEAEYMLCNWCTMQGLDRLGIVAYDITGVIVLHLLLSGVMIAHCHFPAVLAFRLWLCRLMLLSLVLIYFSGWCAEPHLVWAEIEEYQK